MNIFVGNLTAAVTADDLRQLFGGYGTIINAIVMRDTATGRTAEPGDSIARAGEHRAQERPDRGPCARAAPIAAPSAICSRSCSAARSAYNSPKGRPSPLLRYLSHPQSTYRRMPAKAAMFHAQVRGLPALY